MDLIKSEECGFHNGDNVFAAAKGQPEERGSEGVRNGEIVHLEK